MAGIVEKKISEHMCIRVWFGAFHNYNVLEENLDESGCFNIERQRFTR